MFTLTDGAVGKVVHLHGDGEILQVVEELEEGPELLKADALRTHGGYQSRFMRTLDLCHGCSK